MWMKLNATYGYFTYEFCRIERKRIKDSKKICERLALSLEIDNSAFNNISDNNRNENNRSMSKRNKNNPFKFGTLVDGEYFTDRVRELDHVKQVLASENHLVLISPRRYGKTSLVHKAAIETGRPVMFVNLETMTDIHDLAIAFLNRLFKLYPFERLKNMLRNFRFVPTLSKQSYRRHCQFFICTRGEHRHSVGRRNGHDGQCEHKGEETDCCDRRVSGSERDRKAS